MKKLFSNAEEIVENMRIISEILCKEGFSQTDDNRAYRSHQAAMNEVHGGLQPPMVPQTKAYENYTKPLAHGSSYLVSVIVPQERQWDGVLAIRKIEGDKVIGAIPNFGEFSSYESFRKFLHNYGNGTHMEKLYALIP